jgi:hypothetical protein
MTGDLVTWEDSEALRQHFRLGTSIISRRGDVSDPLTNAHEAQGPRRRSGQAHQLLAHLRN